MKIYKSLDFDSQKKRIEPNEAGEYLVHLEDYESLNDLIRRSIRTKTKFNIETNKNAVYDEDFLLEKETEIQNIIDRNQSAEIEEPEKGSTDEVKEPILAGSENGEIGLQ